LLEPNPKHAGPADPWGARRSIIRQAFVNKGVISMTTTTKREVAFIDRYVDDLPTLLAGLRPGVEPVLLSDLEPAPRQMARAVAGRQNLIAIHVLAHGAPGEVHFGTSAMSLESLEQDAPDFGTIGKALGANGKFLLWSCDTGQGARGCAFVSGLARLTGADVRAATGRIGSPILGARWDLDMTYGQSKEAAVAPLSTQGMARYLGLLALSRQDSRAVASAADASNAVADMLSASSASASDHNQVHGALKAIWPLSVICFALLLNIAWIGALVWLFLWIFIF
jgi:Domain of unknown function (DUF4347)